ncbi:DUF1835 domain-containing protein [Paenibacillus roseipurpureus]|uniref:DUF1835 domain-containing protein n=1 Tax=Paenibacillus roseopurpureus TaxID=2918901 RepID=A0AA96LRT7_9BACL|nr:DUF1835 domain-containing protein [Paenibacillus sp. MBLB1832]WNR44743.1 DUF1835 domain-containing protein [Paenibacillus sp. MBLB1832]
MPALHIVNGDSFGNKLRASGIDGEILVWRESLYEGPIGMHMSDSVLLSLRASYMNHCYGIPENLFTSGTLHQEALLNKASSSADELVLWFEHDLYDQLMLCYLLSRLMDRPYQTSLVSMDHFPGVWPFYGLGQLTIDQIRTLHGTWIPILEDQLHLARKVWSAYSAPEPLPMASILEEDLSVLPYLKKALTAHTARYPSVQNGLSAIQELILSLLRDGELSLLSLFSQVSAEASGYGLGDLQFWHILDQMWHCDYPLLRIAGATELPKYGEALPPQFDQVCAGLTEVGRLAATGKADHISLNGIDDWIGGVRMLGKKDIWRRISGSIGFSKL